MSTITIRFETTDEDYVAGARRTDNRDAFLRDTAKLLRLSDDEAATLAVEVH